MAWDTPLADEYMAYKERMRLIVHLETLANTYRFHSASDKAMTEIGWGAFLSKLLSFGCFPAMMSSASLRIWIIASQNLQRNE